MKTRNLFSSALLALSMLALAACGDDTSRVTVKLTDAPGDDFEKAVVTISKVYLKGDGAEGSGEVVLRSEPVTTDLLTLANDTADLVKDAEVPQGTYRELRFVISGAYVQVKEDGVTRVYATDDYEGVPAGVKVDGELQMPSLSTSGLKVKFANDADVEVTSEQTQKVILVDFDVAQSFGKAAGGSGRWVMSPVIKGADLEFSSNVVVTLKAGAGLELPVVGDTQVTLSAFNAVLVNAEGSREPLAFTDANNDGTFEANFKFLIPGAFQVEIEGPAGVSFTTNPGIPASVTATGGAESRADFTLTSVVEL
ncbi:DUF4382 domain-containing protein [Pyxidicoccus fallax]|uniref:DUF4382 domain-containing protein n=1 Tax=Pyxidicoccus fallax TaxID=394095 RepID=A0A848LVS3_9BACT|nr:DUF4382 domain-containing protein [Pyxidicoccus fallax]NMO21720.1 DUF4382 domain-containing protein [Pyxidicoccus fallax]NPC83156.1 DUF4382 domain-containing protein [Pyxidicoccus fallax]